MTLDEAKKIAHIIGQADNGCSFCVSNLAKLCEEQFPEFTWEVDDGNAHADCLPVRVALRSPSHA